MKKTAIGLTVLMLSGCINVYGPVKTDDQPTESNTGSDSSGMSDAVLPVKIGNRSPDELMNAVQLFYQQKGLNASVADASTGIIAAAGNDEELAGIYLDCSMLSQTQNIQEQYRIVSQIWSAGEGSNVSVSVTGVAGLTTPDGNDKVKPVECNSTGLFEKDLLERLRK